MKAFKNTPITKAKLLKHLRWHKEQDAIVSGSYGHAEGEKFVACAVGCSINSINLELGKKLDTSKHECYEEYFNIPEWIARLEDTIFEGLPENRQATWPLEFIEAINIGSDLNKIKPDFMIYVLESCLNNFDNSKYPEVVQAIRSVQDLWVLNPKQDLLEEWCAAESAAWSAAGAGAGAAAESAAWSAAGAAAWFAARSTARSTAWSAAWYAARYAARSAAGFAATAAAYESYADYLLYLIKKCK